MIYRKLYFASFLFLIISVFDTQAQSKVVTKTGFLFISKYNHHYNDPYTTTDVISEHSFNDIFIPSQNLNPKALFVDFLKASKVKTGIALNTFKGREKIRSDNSTLLKNDTAGLAYCYKEDEFYVVTVKIRYINNRYDYGLTVCPDNYVELQVNGEKISFKFITKSIKVLSVEPLVNK